MTGVRVGRLRGIPIEIRYSFLLLLLCAYYGGILMGMGANAFFVLLVGCASVFVHEIAHAVVARLLRLPVLAIELTALGGQTKTAGPPSRPRDEILIAIAGPVASLMVAGAAGLWLLLTNSIWAELAMAMNLLLAALNMAPVLPLDGGRVLRGALSIYIQPRQATELTVKISVGLSLIAAFAGPLLGVWIVLPFSLLLLFSARAELRLFDLWTRGPSARGDVRILDATGRPADGRATTLGSSYIIEEHQSALGRRWLVRDLAGNILLETDVPLGEPDPCHDVAPGAHGSSDAATYCMA